jgi:hypothetical protein
LAKPAARKLKVFQAQLGFYDSVVAAPSRAAALRAWGVHQNLFASGEAHVTEDGDAVKAALERPHTPLKRAVGSKGPFGLAASLPDVPNAPKRRPPAKSAAKAKPEPLKRPPADRTALDAAEAALRTLDEDRRTEDAALRHQQEALDMKKSAAQADYVVRRKSATAAVAEARKAYRKAGGGD